MIENICINNTVKVKKYFLSKQQRKTNREIYDRSQSENRNDESKK